MESTTHRIFRKILCLTYCARRYAPNARCNAVAHSPLPIHNPDHHPFPPCRHSAMLGHNAQSVAECLSPLQSYIGMQPPFLRSLALLSLLYPPCNDNRLILSQAIIMIIPFPPCKSAESRTRSLRPPTTLYTFGSCHHSSSLSSPRCALRIASSSCAAPLAGRVLVVWKRCALRRLRSLALRLSPHLRSLAHLFYGFLARARLTWSARAR